MQKIDSNLLNKFRGSCDVGRNPRKLLSKSFKRQHFDSLSESFVGINAIEDNALNSAFKKPL